MRYHARKCESPSCGLRFPVEEDSPLGKSCPICGEPTQFVDDSYLTHQIRSDPQKNGPNVHALLDNIRSLRNVGSIFRTADGAGIRRLHLGGFTPTPDHPKLAKTALGAERAVPWTHHRDAYEGAEALVAGGATLWALEGGPRSQSLFDVLHDRNLDDTHAETPIVLVVGHEVSGVDPRIVERSARVVHLPMAGVKGSLNVGVAFGVAVYLMTHMGPAEQHREHGGHSTDPRGPEQK